MPAYKFLLRCLHPLSEVIKIGSGGGLKTRRHLRDLTEDSLCDPFLSFLHPRPLSWAPAKILLEQIPQFLAKARRWSVQYDEYGNLSIYEETHLLEPPPDKRLDQGNAQGMRVLNLLFASTSACANRSCYGSSYTSINI